MQSENIYVDFNFKVLFLNNSPTSSLLFDLASSAFRFLALSTDSASKNFSEITLKKLLEESLLKKMFTFFRFTVFTETRLFLFGALKRATRGSLV